MLTNICQLYFIGVFMLCFYHETHSIRNSPKIVEADQEYGFVLNRRRTIRHLFELRNRDLPRFPEEKDERLQTSYIIEAHEVLRKGLQEFLNLNATDLGTYLSYLIFNRTDPFEDEYGQNIRNYKKVFRFIWAQYNETLAQNYAIEQFNKDKLDLCSAARFLSHQPTVQHRETIMKRMGDALRYKCHPCTPYTPKQYDETIVPSTDDINPEGMPTEEILILCNKTQEKLLINSTFYTITVKSKCTKEVEDFEGASSYITDAHQVLLKGFQDLLRFIDSNDLGAYLNYFIYQRTEPFVDEYGQVLKNLRKVFRFVWEQHNETLAQNYTVTRFKKDRLYLCSIARYLSHQPTVEHRTTIMKRMGNALRYQCHPCTPYTPKQYDETIVPSIDGINPDISPEESIILCNGNWDQRPSTLITTTDSPIEFTTTPITIEESFENITTEESIKPLNPLYSYAPCDFSSGNVVCDQVPLQEVQRVFRQTLLPSLKSIKLTLQAFNLTETFLPEDLLGRKRTLELWIEFSDMIAVLNGSLRVHIDSNAFRSTKSYTKTLKLNAIDCFLLNFNFTSGFDNLKEFYLTNIWNIQMYLPTLPTLSSLTTLVIGYSSGMNELYSFPFLKNGLKNFDLLGFENYPPESSLTDETLERVMDWLLISSENTLEELRIVNMNRVTRVPKQISSFKALRKLWLHNNNISTIKSEELYFTAPVSLLDIKQNGIKEIEAAAFQGNFENAEVYVSINNLASFKESIFGGILEQMASGIGSIILSPEKNPVDCSKESICNLAWLRLYNAGVQVSPFLCPNETVFIDLLSAGFNHCSQIETSIE